MGGRRRRGMKGKGSVTMRGGEGERRTAEEDRWYDRRKDVGEERWKKRKQEGDNKTKTTNVKNDVRTGCR